MGLRLSTCAIGIAGLLAITVPFFAGVENPWLFDAAGKGVIAFACFRAIRDRDYGVAIFLATALLVLWAERFQLSGEFASVWDTFMYLDFAHFVEQKPAEALSAYSGFPAFPSFLVFMRRLTGSEDYLLLVKLLMPLVNVLFACSIVVWTKEFLQEDAAAAAIVLFSLLLGAVNLHMSPMLFASALLLYPLALLFRSRSAGGRDARFTLAAVLVFLAMVPLHHSTAFTLVVAFGGVLALQAARRWLRFPIALGFSRSSSALGVVSTSLVVFMLVVYAGWWFFNEYAYQALGGMVKMAIESTLPTVHEFYAHGQFQSNATLLSRVFNRTPWAAYALFAVLGAYLGLREKQEFVLPVLGAAAALAVMFAVVLVTSQGVILDSMRFVSAAFILCSVAAGYAAAWGARRHPALIAAAVFVPVLLNAAANPSENRFHSTLDRFDKHDFYSGEWVSKNIGGKIIAGSKEFFFWLYYFNVTTEIYSRYENFYFNKVTINGTLREMDLAYLSNSPNDPITVNGSFVPLTRAIPPGDLRDNFDLIYSNREGMVYFRR